MMYRTKGFTSKQGNLWATSHWLGACAAGGRTLRVCPSAVPLGRSDPRARPAPGGGPAFFGKAGRETQGSALDPDFQAARSHSLDLAFVCIGMVAKCFVSIY